MSTFQGDPAERGCGPEGRWAMLGESKPFKNLKDDPLGRLMGRPQGDSCSYDFHPSGWLWASARTCCSISLDGMKWSCLRINETPLSPSWADRAAHGVDPPASTQHGSKQNMACVCCLSLISNQRPCRTGCEPHVLHYRGISLMRKRHTVGPNGRTMPRVLGGS